MTDAIIWRGVFTFMLLLAVLAVVVFAMVNLTAVPVQENGVVVLDPFANAKDLLALVLAPASLALGYWFGASGRDKAEADRQRADTEATEARVVANVLAANAPSDVVDGLRNSAPGVLND